MCNFRGVVFTCVILGVYFLHDPYLLFLRNSIFEKEDLYVTKKDYL